MKLAVPANLTFSWASKGSSSGYKLLQERLSGNANSKVKLPVQALAGENTDGIARIVTREIP